MGIFFHYGLSSFVYVTGLVVGDVTEPPYFLECFECVQDERNKNLYYKKSTEYTSVPVTDLNKMRFMRLLTENELLCLVFEEEEV